MEITLSDIVDTYDYVILDTNPYKKQSSFEQDNYFFRGNMSELTIDQLRKMERDQKKILDFYKNDNIVTVENVLKELQRANRICTERLANFTGYTNAKIRVNKGKPNDSIKQNKNIIKRYKKVLRLMTQTSNLAKSKIIKPSIELNNIWEELKGISRNYRVKKIKSKEEYTDEQIIAAAIHLNKNKNVSIISCDYDLINIYVKAIEVSEADCVFESIKSQELMDFFIANQTLQSYNFFEKSTVLKNVRSNQMYSENMATENVYLK